MNRAVAGAWHTTPLPTARRNARVAAASNKAAGRWRMSDGSDGEIDRCEECGDSGVPLRSILMLEKIRKSLCESCFEEALNEGRVSPSDPRVDETVGGRRV